MCCEEQSLFDRVAGSQRRGLLGHMTPTSVLLCTGWSTTSVSFRADLFARGGTAAPFYRTPPEGGVTRAPVMILVPDRYISLPEKPLHFREKSTPQVLAFTPKIGKCSRLHPK